MSKDKQFAPDGADVPSTGSEQTLRQRAELVFSENAAGRVENLEALSPDEVRRMLHELQIHQIELEMQNEELRKVQAELVAARARYFDLYDLAPVGYFTLSEKGMIMEANLTAATLLCVTRSVLFKRRLADFILPEDQDIYYGHRKQLFETGAPHVCDLRMLRADADHFWARIEANIPQDIDGTTVCRATMSDVTEHKRGEAELRLSEENFRRSMDDSPLGKRIVTGEGETIYANRAFLQLYGYDSVEELKTTATEKRYTSESYAEFMIRREKRRQGVDELSEYNIAIIRKNGEVRHLQVIRKEILWDGERQYQAIYQDITERRRAEEKLQQTLDSLRKSFGTIVQVLVSAVETRDPTTSGHQNRSADLARAIATELGFPQARSLGIHMAGIIHDIGKLSVPADILSKPTKLHELELRLIKEHAKKGFEMLKDVESPWPLAEIVYQHHERMDGSGYPRKLKGAEILIEARILAVADVVEAMVSHRPYRPSLGLDAALTEIENNKGTLYDADVVDACLRLFREKGFQLEGT